MELPLTKGSFVRIDDISEVEVTCLDGSVWLTTDDDPRDTVLTAGNSFISNVHRRAIVSALGASRIRIDKASFKASGGLASGLAGLFAPRGKAAPC